MTPTKPHLPVMRFLLHGLKASSFTYPFTDRDLMTRKAWDIKLRRKMCITIQYDTKIVHGSQKAALYFEGILQN